MKFNSIIGNPPYSELKPGNKKSKAIWEKFVNLSLELVKENGYVCLIHPSGWRKPNSKIGNIIKQQQILYLEMHSTFDGLKTFKCYTDYDWYIVKNMKYENPTVIKDYNGEITKNNLNFMPFIPNAQINKVMDLVAKNGEEKVELLHSHSAYETRKDHMNKEKTQEFKYPCVYIVGGLNTNFWYSSRKEQFFNLPKVVWGNGRSGVIIDSNGKYGLTQFAYGITDKKENLSKIQKALKSSEFIKNIMGHTKGGGHRYDKNIIRLFRKDFYKEFIDEI